MSTSGSSTPMLPASHQQSERDKDSSTLDLETTPADWSNPVSQEDSHENSDDSAGTHIDLLRRYIASVHDIHLPETTIAEESAVTTLKKPDEGKRSSKLSNAEADAIRSLLPSLANGFDQLTKAIRESNDNHSVINKMMKLLVNEMEKRQRNKRALEDTFEEEEEGHSSKKSKQVRSKKKRDYEAEVSNPLTTANGTD